MPVTTKICASSEEYGLAKKMAGDYAEFLNTDLSFQNFEDELKHVASINGEPDGAMLIAMSETSHCAGCVGLRRFDSKTCEMKRLFVYDMYRGTGIGKMLVKEFMKHAEIKGYHRARLDTFPTMTAALRLYEKFGFYRIESYRYNPDPEAVFLERLIYPQLQPAQTS